MCMRSQWHAHGDGGTYIFVGVHALPLAVRTSVSDDSYSLPGLQ